MAEPDEAYNFEPTFLNLCQAGKKARLVLECEAGQAYVNLQLYLGPHHQQPLQNGQEHHQQPHRRPDVVVHDVQRHVLQKQLPMLHLSVQMQL